MPEKKANSDTTAPDPNGLVDMRRLEKVLDAVIDASKADAPVSKSTLPDQPSTPAQQLARAVEDPCVAQAFKSLLEKAVQRSRNEAAIKDRLERLEKVAQLKRIENLETKSRLEPRLDALEKSRAAEALSEQYGRAAQIRHFMGEFNKAREAGDSVKANQALHSVAAAESSTGLSREAMAAFVKAVGAPKPSTPKPELVFKSRQHACEALLRKAVELRARGDVSNALLLETKAATLDGSLGLVA